MSLRDELLQKLEEREAGIMLAELYGTFNTVDLLDEVKKLTEEGRVEVINKNRVRLTQ
jgi:hypothetical protein